jgi:hypothetical protein
MLWQVVLMGWETAAPSQAHTRLRRSVMRDIVKVDIHNKLWITIINY